MVDVGCVYIFQSCFLTVRHDDLTMWRLDMNEIVVSRTRV